jgi:hypothetical protein
MMTKIHYALEQCWCIVMVMILTTRKGVDMFESVPSIEELQELALDDVVLHNVFKMYASGAIKLEDGLLFYVKYASITINKMKEELLNKLIAGTYSVIETKNTDGDS